MAILFAAAHPERTRALMLVARTPGSRHVRITRSGCRPSNSTNRCATSSLDGERGVGLGALGPERRRRLRRPRILRSMQRLAASPGAAMALMSSYMDIDVRPALQLVHAPTLVVHRIGDRMVPIAHGRYLAEHIRGARLVELPGTDHFWWTEDTDRILGEAEEFLTGARSVPEPNRVLASVLFTDIVDSTRLAVELGDSDWRVLLDRHDAMAERLVAQHGGRLVKTTGDGVLATFDGPARSVRCARAISEGAHTLGIELRAGVHTGEVELRGDDIAGLGVNIASRIEALAHPREVLVSRTVTDLVAGSGLEFHDRGEHQLKGVPGQLASLLGEKLKKAGASGPEGLHDLDCLQ